MYQLVGKVDDETKELWVTDSAHVFEQYMATPPEDRARLVAGLIAQGKVRRLTWTDCGTRQITYR